MCAKRLDRSEIFWEKVDKNGPVIRPELGHCWQWTASVDRRGYGQVNRWVNGRAKIYRAHRYAWTLLRGPIQSHEHLLHACDNPKCVNPDHLRIGTPRENQQDCISRNRQRHARILTPEQAHQAKYGKESQVFYAREFGVCQSSISDIRTGRTWKEI